MQRKHRQQQKEKQKQEVIDLQPDIRNLLSLQYLISFPQNVNSLTQLIRIAETGLQQNILKFKYDLKNQHVIRYGIKDFQLNECPFEQKQIEFINQLVQVCQTILRNKDYNTTMDSLKKLNAILHEECHHSNMRDEHPQQIQKIQEIPYRKLQAQKQLQFHQKQVQKYEQEQNKIDFKISKLKVHLNQKFKELNLNFKYITFKQAIVYETLSRCQIWFTICRQRKKSGKGFHLDPLINTFDSIIKKAEIKGPAFHVSVLPRRNIQNLQKKKNIQKSKNPLFDAVSNRNHAQVKRLILNGADIEAPAFGNQRLAREMKCAHKAAENNDLEMCKILTSFGVNWQSEDSEKMTPLFSAIYGCSFEVMKYLVEQIKVNIQKKQVQNRTPFYWACTEGQLQYIKYLYEHGANVNQKSKLGRCALSKACFLGRRDIVQFLLSCKQIEMISKDEKGRTPLHNATFGPKGGRQGQKFGTNAGDSPQCAQILLQKGFPVDERDLENNTAMHISASSEALNSIPILMAFGASLTAFNDYGETPLMTAAKFGHYETVKLLYETYGSPILYKDIFGKNIILLVAKFRQFKENTFKNFPAEGSVQEKTVFRKQNTEINPVFKYIVDKFIYQAYSKYQDPKYNDPIYDQEKKTNLKQIHETFHEMIKYAVHEQFMQFTQKMIEFKVPFPELKLKDAKMLLQMEQLFEGEQQKKLVLSILHSKNQDGYHVFQLQKEAIVEFVTWLIRKNSIGLLEFVSANQVLMFYHFNKYSHKEQIQPFHQLPMQILVSSIPVLKEKVITFCLLNLTFNWIEYIDPNTGGNILHLLVRTRKVGSLIQLTKLLGGKKMNFVKNKHIIDLIHKEQKIEEELKDKYQFRHSPINQLFMSLLGHQDNDGINPYQLAHIVKQTSIIKIFSQRLKQTSLSKGSQTLEKLDVKQFKIERQTLDLQELKLFEAGHQKQKDLESFIQEIQACKTKQQLAQHLKIFASDTKELGEKVNIQSDVQLEWNNFKKRPLHFIKTQKDIDILKVLLHGPKVVGIDVEYDFADGNQTIICIIQLSSLQEDYIIDMMSCAFQNNENRYIPFINKLKNEFFKPLCYDKTITKLMHGSDHDLYILKSCFNCSFINFLDSSRIDVDLRKIKEGLKKSDNIQQQDNQSQKKETKIPQVGSQKVENTEQNSIITPHKETKPQNKSLQFSITKTQTAKRPNAAGVRGLATLAKQYLNITMSKDHQVSEWKIRPLPATMVDYARRDSMIMPFLVHKMLTKFQKISDLKDSIINGFRLAKKNKKPQQPLIKNIVPL